MNKPSVIIIEEQAGINTGCCVPFDNEIAKTLIKDVSLSKQQEIKTISELYKKLLEQYNDQIELIKVDPRNPIYLLPKLTKETISNRVPLFKALKTIFFYRTPAVIVNGELISTGKNMIDLSLFEKIKEKLQ